MTRTKTVPAAKTNLCPLLHYAARRMLTADETRVGLLFARLYHAAYRTPCGSNAAMWERVAKQGGWSARTGSDVSDPFIGTASALNHLAALKQEIKSSDWNMLVHVCVHEHAAGRGKFESLKVALRALLDVWLRQNARY